MNQNIITQKKLNYLKKIKGKMQLKDITAIHVMLAGETPIKDGF